MKYTILHNLLKRIIKNTIPYNKETFKENWENLIQNNGSISFECGECNHGSHSVKEIGQKKQHTYIKIKCSNCGEIDYWSLDELKHKPRGLN